MPNGRGWNKTDERLLRKYYAAGMHRDEIAELLERSELAIKTRLGRLGLTRPRRWTAEQIETAKAHRGKLTIGQISTLVGKSETAVYQLFNRLGLVKKQKKRPALLRLIKAKHKLGWSDAEICNEWNRRHPDDQLDRRWIQELRRDKLGLPHNAYSKHRRKKVAAKTREQCRVAGVRNLAEVRRLAYDAFARRQGWPADLRPRAVQICKLLYERGPHTRRQIAEAIGMPWKGSRKSLVSNDPEGSYLAHLIARGLVVQLPRLVKGRGKGTSVHLYAIAPHVRRGVAI